MHTSSYILFFPHKIYEGIVFYFVSISLLCYAHGNKQFATACSEPSQTLGVFCKNSKRLIAVNHFHKTLDLRCLIEL